MLITRVNSKVQQPTEICWPNPFFRLLLDFLRLVSLCIEGGHRLYYLFKYMVVVYTFIKVKMCGWVMVLVFLHEMGPLLREVELYVVYVLLHFA